MTRYNLYSIDIFTNIKTKFMNIFLNKIYVKVQDGDFYIKNKQANSKCSYILSRFIDSINYFKTTLRNILLKNILTVHDFVSN